MHNKLTTLTPWQNKERKTTRQSTVYETKHKKKREKRTPPKNLR